MSLSGRLARNEDELTKLIEHLIWYQLVSPGLITKAVSRGMKIRDEKQLARGLRECGLVRVQDVGARGD